MKRIISLAFFACIIITISGANHKFNSTVDGYIYQSGDGSNFTNANMELKKSSSFARELYLTFNVSSLSIQGKSAFLRIYCNSYDKNGSMGISVDGFEGTVPTTLKWTTKSTLPATTPASIEKSFSETDVNIYYKWDVSEFVKTMLAKGISVFSFRVYITTGNDALLKFNTAENALSKPELEISETEVIPETHNIKLSRIFDNHMVLQRNKKVSVWGQANPQKELKLTFNGQNKVTTTDVSGNWKVILDEMTAGGPFDMDITCDADTITLTDILVGDVYLAGGQSNMAFRVASLTAEARTELALDINYPNIRYYDVARIISGGVFLNESDRPWTVCNNFRIDEWSAVATYFARQIHKEEGVPIGIVGCNHGGSTADAWISPEAYTADATLNAAKIEPYTTILQYYCNPSTLYEAMLKKVIGYQLNGFIWYQGEANTYFADKYKTTFSGMIKDWRRIWNDDNLPFIFAQLSSFKPTDDPLGVSWALLREAQLKTNQTVAKTAMVVTIDVGDIANIHPTDKKTVGERFTLAAKQLIYNKNIELSGPIFDQISFSNNNAFVSFSHAANGLKSAQDTLGGFEICSNDYLYKQAKAVIVDGKMKVWNDLVQNPVAVRYAWSNGPESTTLYNTEGLPASPFRSMVEPKLTTQNIPFEEFTAYSSASYATREVKYAFNGAGMNNDGQTHGNTANSITWHSNVGNVFPYFIKVKFITPELIEKIKIWNFNWSTYLLRGVKDMDIYYSTSIDDLSSVAYTDSRWVKYQAYQLTAADGTNTYKGESLAMDFQKNVSWVGFNIRSGQGDVGGYVGLSEIQFFRKETTSVPVLEEKRIIQLKKNDVSINNNLNSPLNFGIVDFLGRTLNQKIISVGENFNLSLNNFPPSCYLIYVRNNNYSENKKIFVQ